MEERHHAFKKREELIHRLHLLDSLLIAYSGGVDSTFLLAMAQHVLGERVMAVTACSPIHPLREKREALDFIRDRGIEHLLLESDETRSTKFLVNAPDRCYWCKKALFEKILHLANEKNISSVAHGANLDDLADYRPGNKAMRELGIIAPLMAARLTKEDIRLLSRDMGLPTWDKPARACLASRIPYGEPITEEKLAMVEAAEEFLMAKGFRQCRVRHHGTVARIELEGVDGPKFFQKDLREETVMRFKEIGFLHISLDLEGYSTGNLNRVLGKANPSGNDHHGE